MDYYTKAKQLSNKDFKQLIGVKKLTFDTMVTILKKAYSSKPKKWRGGRKRSLLWRTSRPTAFEIKKKRTRF